MYITINKIISSNPKFDIIEKILTIPFISNIRLNKEIIAEKTKFKNLFILLNYLTC